MSYFTVNELTKSATAKAHHIPNNPDPISKDNLIALKGNILETARYEFGKPINVSSGYRSRILNKTVGGAPTSQHVQGKAADLIVNGGKEELLRLFHILMKIPHDQLIWENTWIHVSYDRTRLRQQNLMYRPHGNPKYINYDEKLV